VIHPVTSQDSLQLGVGGPLDCADASVLDALAARAAKGDKPAFEQIYLGLVDEIYAYVHGQCREAATAEDIVANVFLRAWRSARTYRSGSQQFRQWIFTIARNELADHWRSQPPTLPLLDLDFPDVHEIEESIDPQVARAEALRALAVLTRDQQQVVVLRYFGNKTHREIALILGKREGAVRALLVRALRQMRKVMADAAP
jgi:RNA polymerase sigma-70 factor (ECF subfamily)